jgi:antitoxin component of RelBE/YafQ-DinJ toxin-antitoxin module
LEALVDPAVNTLRKVLQHGIDTGNASSAVRAALGILDRCGFHPSQAIELTGKDGGAIETAIPFRTDLLSIEEKQTLVELLEKAGVSVGSEVGRS